MTDIEEYGLVKNGREYFSFSALIPCDRHFTNWMTVIDGELHDADWIEDDTYEDNEDIPTSPVVNIPAPVDIVNDHLRPVLLQMFLTAISEKVGFNVDVPMLCEAREVEEIAALKLAAGYSWDVDDQTYLKDSIKEVDELLASTAVQGEPVAVMYEDGTVLTKTDCGDSFAICCEVQTPLYTAPQPVEQQPEPDELSDYDRGFRDGKLDRLIDEVVAESTLVEVLEQGFPLLSDEGLDEVEHHCEWVVQRERKRVHSILAAHRKGGDQQ